MGLSFTIDKRFLEKYKNLQEPFGYNGLGAVTFYRTYSRKKENGEYETWLDVCERTINGMYSIQKDHCLANSRPWNEEKAQKSAQEALDRMFNLKWTPSGRGMWMMGTDFIHKRKISEALLNCAAITTEDIDSKGGKIFEWFMEMLMLGVGVGADTKGAGKVMIEKPIEKKQIHIIPDSREGWAESVRVLFDSFVIKIGEKTNKKNRIVFDYSQIRKKGLPIKGFGGVASGPEPLIELHKRMHEFLTKNSGKPITTRTIVDIFNAIGACVVSGNVRRSAEIMLGDPEDTEFLELKNYDLNPDRAEIGWSSNNSIFAKRGMDYSPYIENIMKNGEPGFVWIENTQKYGRLYEERADNATLFNPCSEQPLASKEMCLLTEIYLNRHDDIYDFLRTIKFAYLYAKSVSLTYEWIRDKESREIMCKNRRIGLSVTGIVQFITKKGIESFIEWSRTGYQYARHYDKHYSGWLGVNESIRVTTVKPSGSISLLGGATPGIHFPHSRYYIRRIRIASNSPMVKYLEKLGFRTEPDFYSTETTVVEFPIYAGGSMPAENEVSIWEQLELVELLQTHWSDNAVSVTIKVNPENVTHDELKRALQLYESKLKAVSFLPEIDGGAYKQMPYQAITEEEYNNYLAKINMEGLNNLAIAMSNASKMEDKYCDGTACAIA